MKRIVTVVFLLALLAGATVAQDSEQRFQIHGFVTQGLLYSSANNYLSTSTSDGSAQWSDAAVSVNSSVIDKLRIGIQLHVYQLGVLGGSNVQLDWASGDYRVNDKFGVRVGKVKTVYGLFNDSQDVDAVHLWSLLPEPFYAPDNKSFNLAHYGGDIYGAVPIGEKAGKLAYTFYGGYRPLDPNGGYVRLLSSFGFSFPSAPDGTVIGGDLRWHLPLRGALVGASLQAMDLNGTGTLTVPGVGAMPATITVNRKVIPDYYARYERGKFFVGGEYKRFALSGPFTGIGEFQQDERSWYVMASYRALPKLALGTYYTHETDKTDPANYYKDWTVSGRYDFNSYFYAKAEGHFIRSLGVFTQSNLLGFYAQDNTGTFNPKTNLMALKLGFSF